MMGFMLGWMRGAINVRVIEKSWVVACGAYREVVEWSIGKLIFGWGFGFEKVVST